MKDTAGRAVAAAVVVVAILRPFLATNDHEGKLQLVTPQAAGVLTVAALGHGSKTTALAPDDSGSLSVVLPEAAFVSARITDEGGGKIPCKVQFIGREGTRTPDFGPDTGEHAVKNLYYSDDGRFRCDLEPGSYDVIVSHGPEYDAVFTRVDTRGGMRAMLTGVLVRSV